MSGSLDLAEIAAEQERKPLVGFTPIVLDPAGPTEADLDDVHDSDRLPCASGPLPSRRSLRSSGASGARSTASRSGERSPTRSGTTSRPAGSRSGAAPAGGTGRSLSSHRSGAKDAGSPSARGRVRPAPPVVTGPPTSALGLDETLPNLASLPLAFGVDDSTATGGLARPFVNEASLPDWVTLDDVPPPVSVDVFQKAVRAGLAPEEAAAKLAERPGLELGNAARSVVDDDEAADSPALRHRTRREQRARERALTSARGVTVRRLAKGGVLAITALGVVSSATPQTLGAIGFDRDDLAASSQGALDFAGAMAPKVNVPALSPEGRALRQQLQRQRVLRRELADQTADEAANAGTTAGGALLDLAFQQDRAVEARRQAEYAQAIRNAARDPRGAAAKLAADRGWTGSQFQCLDRLWERESQWNYRAVNRSSGAYGIAQALPGGKMAAVGADWRTNPITQIKWGLNYIDERYGTPCGAWAHSEAYGWY
jgi:hypothetical protein